MAKNYHKKFGCYKYTKKGENIKMYNLHIQGVETKLVRIEVGEHLVSECLWILDRFYVFRGVLKAFEPLKVKEH